MKVYVYVLLATAVICFASPAEAQNLSIYTENNPPVSYLENGKPAGTAVEIAREILRRVKQSDTIEIVPWARGYNSAMTQADVALFSATRLPHREYLFHWVGPIYTQTWGFYAHKGGVDKIGSLDEAKSAGRIGTYRDDAKEQFLKQMGFSNIVSANRNLTNVRRLIQGDIELWVSSDLNVGHIVEQAGEDPAEVVLVYPFRKVENYIVFSLQTNIEIVEQWRKTLEDMKRDGTYSRILNNNSQ